ncbi:hypothetical protein SAMN05428966_109334 [Massilia sp. PDC64]|nr:hypothetical protein [Massilia sp. PDC64]SDE65782.1 hypothetical protein SAMN05428966_109334 [Massilia sp. PDC64]
MTRSRILVLAAALLLIALLSAALWVMFAPIPAGSREQLFEIPAGTYARRAAGDKVEVLPTAIRLTLGVKDILVLKNLDNVPQTFGPVLIMPGQSFRMPFGVAGDVQFECTAHASGQMRIVVDPAPDAGWRRLVWRARQWW